MPKHSHRAKWNTANAVLAKRLMDAMFYGHLDCLRCGKRWEPAAYAPVDLCPECYKELEAAEHQMHPTSGNVRDLQAVSTPENSATSQADPNPPTSG